MPKHIKTESKKEPEPPAPKKSAHKAAESYHDVSVPSSEFKLYEKENQSTEEKGKQ